MPPKPVLFTVGPIMTSDTVKEAMLTDYGSRDEKFVKAVAEVRNKIVKLASVNPNEWVCIMQPGAGTMGIEGCIGTVLPRGGKYLLINSGKYSERQRAIVKRFNENFVELKLGEGEEIRFDDLEALLKANPDVTTVGYVHHETSTGMLYPGERIYATVRKYLPKAVVFADCISSFGGIAFDVSSSCDIMVTSSNKCFHSVPGVSIILTRRAIIQKGVARSVTLDLANQLASFDKSGQFVITPPTHVIMALQQALSEYDVEGGLAARQQSYAAKGHVIRSAAKELGFELFLKENLPSTANICVCVRMPTDPKWNFKKFYTYLNKHGCIIYPGKASHAETFRFGIIGHTSVSDVKRLMSCSKDALASMGITRLKKGSNL